MPFLKSDLFTNREHSTNRPISLSVKDYIIRRLAPKMMLGEKTIEAVVNHQFHSAHSALVNNKSLELSGFGKLIFNEKKAVKQMAKYESQKAVFQRMANNPELSEQKRNNARLKLQSALDNIEALKPKMYAVTDIRGMEEQFASSGEAEETNQQN